MTDLTPTPSPAPVWPDEATVERAAEAMSVAEIQWFNAPTPSGDPGDTSDYFPTLARAALSVLPDPTADTVLLAKVREIVAEWEERGATWCMTRIAALLAGGDR